MWYNTWTSLAMFSGKKPYAARRWRRVGWGQSWVSRGPRLPGSSGETGRGRGTGNGGDRQQRVPEGRVSSSAPDSSVACTPACSPVSGTCRPGQHWVDICSHLKEANNAKVSAVCMHNVSISKALVYELIVVRVALTFSKQKQFHYHSDS